MPNSLSPAKPDDASAAVQNAVVRARPAPVDPSTQRPAPDPTRYGDWEKNGRCIDF